MTDKISIGGLDYSAEGTQVGMYLVALTAANFDAQIAKAQALQTAIQSISLIDFEGLKISHVDAVTETDKPSSPYAQREHKWLISYSDNVTSKLYQTEVGGADLTLLGSDGATMDVSAGTGAAFVTSFNTNAVSPEGNAVTFISAVHVGRNT